MARTKKDPARKAKLSPCGHGSRHISPYDGRCRRCVRDAVKDGNHPAIVDRVVAPTKAKRDADDVAMQAVSNAA